MGQSFPIHKYWQNESTKKENKAFTRNSLIKPLVVVCRSSHRAGFPTWGSGAPTKNHKISLGVTKWFIGQERKILLYYKFINPEISQLITRKLTSNILTLSFYVNNGKMLKTKCSFPPLKWKDFLFPLS